MSPALRRLLCWLSAGLALVSATVLVTLWAGRPLFYSDGARLASAFELRDASMIAWSRPEPIHELPGPVRGRAELLPDGRVLYGREVSETDTELVVWDPRRKDLAPEPVVALATKAHELSPFLARDGTLYFASDREGGAGGFDLWSVPWRDGKAGVPAALPDGINTAFDEIDPTCDGSGSKLVFARRDDGKAARLFVAPLDAPASCQPLFEDEIDPRRNGTAAGRIVMDRDPCWAADDASLWFVREIQGSPARLLRTARLGERFAEPYEVGIGAGFLAPRPSAQELWLLGAPAARGDAAARVALLYRSRAEELLPWHDAQRLVQTILSSTLFASLLTLVLLLLGRRFTQLDLITICLLASLLLHLVVLLWLGRVEIVRRLAPLGEEGGRLEVTIVSALEGGARAVLGASGVVEDASLERHQGALEALVPATGLEQAALAGAEPRGPTEPPAGPAGLEAPASDLRDAASAEAARRSAKDAGPEVGAARCAEREAPVVASGVAPQRKAAPGGATEIVTTPPTELGALAVRLEAPASGAAPERIEPAALVVRAPVPAPGVAEVHDSQPAPGARETRGAREPRAAAAVPAADPTPAPPAQAATAGAGPGPVVAAQRPLAVPAGGGGRAEPVVAPPSDLMSLASEPRATGAAAAPPPVSAAPQPAGLARAPVPAASLRDTAAPPPRSGPEAPGVSGRGVADPVPTPAEVRGAGPAVAGAGSVAPRPEREGARAAHDEPPLAPPASDLLALVARAPPPADPSGAPSSGAPSSGAPWPGAVPLVAPRPAAVRDARDDRGGRASGPNATAPRGPDARVARAVPAEPGPSGALVVPAEPAPSGATPPRLTFMPRRVSDRHGAGGAAPVPPPGSFLEPAEPGERTALVAVADVSPYQNRFGPRRAEALERFGGSAETEAAVFQGLRYLAKIQQEDGAWGVRPMRDPKYGDVRVGKTALCLLAFLGGGHLPGREGPHQTSVESAVAYLLEQQDAQTGHFGRSSAYDHGIATYALAECYGLTHEQRLAGPLERALDWILQKQNRTRDARNEGGWGYFSPVLQPEDRFSRTSITAWMVMALESAKLAGFTIDGDALARAREYLLRSFDEENGYFLYSKEPGRLASQWRTLPASTPASVFAALLLGVGGDDRRLRAGLEFTIERKPALYRRADSDAFVKRAAGNVYFWYYGSLACFLTGGAVWEEWNTALKAVLLPAQAKDGSFAPIDVYADQAGDTARDRAYTTAMCVLSLEVYYRYFTPLLKGR